LTISNEQWRNQTDEKVVKRLSDCPIVLTLFGRPTTLPATDRLKESLGFIHKPLDIYSLVCDIATWLSWNKSWLTTMAIATTIMWYRAGSVVKLCPRGREFAEDILQNPQAVLETEFRHYSRLAEGATIAMRYNRKSYVSTWRNCGRPRGEERSV
jgi:hypothetical protein